LNNYRSYISTVLGLDNSATGDQPFIDAMVNEGVERFMLDTHVKTSVATMSLTSGTSDYVLPSSILQIRDMYNTYGSQNYGMEARSIDEINLLRQASSSRPPARFYSVDGDLLSLYPAPGSGETLTVYYVPRPATLTSGTDSPTEIPFEYHAAPEFWALWRCANMDDDSTSGQGLQYRAEYDRMVRECRKYLSRKGGARLGRAVVNPRMRVGVPHDPSQDVTW
jgi:hypothetical protein